MGNRSSIQGTQGTVTDNRSSIQDTPATVMENRSSIQGTPGTVTEIRSSIQGTQGPLTENRSSIQDTPATVMKNRSSIQGTQGTLLENRSSIQRTQGTVMANRSSIQRTQGPLTENRSSIQRTHGPLTEYRSSIQRTQGPLTENRSYIQRTQETVTKYEKLRSRRGKSKFTAYNDFYFESGDYTFDSYTGLYMSNPDTRFSLEEKCVYESFMEYVVNTGISFKRSKKEIADIKHAVDEYVDAISIYFKKSVGLEICHRYLVGSMAEETRIWEPDEFDFIFAVRDYTEDDVMTEVCTGCDKQIDKGTHPHLRMKDSAKGNRLQFEKYFYDIKQGINEEMKPLPTDSGILVWKQIIPYHQGPAITCFWEWIPTEGKTLKITADIVLAIERSHVTRIIDGNKISCEKYLPHLLQENKYFIIKHLHKKAQLYRIRSDQFKFTFTTTEIKLMKEVLSDKHKMCYKFLKFLYGLYCHSRPSSYQMKCLTLRHAAQCDENQTYVLDCIEDIMQRIVILFNGERKCKPTDEDNKFSIFLSDTKLSNSVNTASERAMVTTTFRLKHILRVIADQWTGEKSNQYVFELLLSELYKSFAL